MSVRKLKVVLTRRLPDAVETRMRELFDAELNLKDQPMDRAALEAAVQRAEVLAPTITDVIDAALINGAGEQLKMIANFGAGVDHIDVEAAVARGIIVTNTPGVLTEDTADLAMSLILAVSRRIVEGAQVVAEGRFEGWTPTWMCGRKLWGKRLGIVGMGRIGQATARRAMAFGMKVSYWNRRALDLPSDLAALPWERDLDALFGACDVISLHTPATAETENMVDRRRIGLMPQGAVLVNTARGSLVDDDALIEALTTGRLFAAGLDVFRGEPALDPRYKTLPNVYLLPHIGSATQETRAAMGHKAVDNLEAFFKTGVIPDRVC
jgi:glyoxylate reductase